jgi:opacity protein-like surface antigen
MRRVIVLAVSLFSLGFSPIAQESRSEISIQGTGYFTTGSANNDGTAYSATETGGLLGTYRFHLNHWLSIEGAYGIDRNTQKYLINSGDFRIQSDIHQLTTAFVLGLPATARRRLRPYILMGGGALIFAPTGNQFDTLTGAQAQTKGAFVYGLGMNYAVLRQMSLRFEYRGLVYGAPDFGFGGLNTNSTAHTAEPSVGLAFRF